MSGVGGGGGGAVSSHSSHHPQEVLLAQFSLLCAQRWPKTPLTSLETGMFNHGVPKCFVLPLYYYFLLTCRSHVWSVSTRRCCVNSIQTRLFVGPALCQHWVKTSNPMLVYCWASVCDAGPTSHQHCFDVSCPSSRGH